METLLQQGAEYEQYICDIIKQKYINCWVWNKIPSEVLLKIGFINDITEKCDDIGCDILGENKDGTYDYIQCKNYTTLGIENTINISDLSGFYNFVAENDVKNAIVYYSGILSSQILCRKKKIKYVKMPFVKLHNKEIKPRDYQIEAFNKLNNVKRGILEMPCGTGKTLITYLISLNYDNIILLSPLIATTEQLIIHYKNYYNTDKDINFNIISSAHTRNLDNIILGNKNIIGSTFDSCDIINNVISKLTGSIFIVIDEFHNLTENNITDNTNELNKLLVSNYKILFVSATPKKYNEELNSIFGTERYKLSWEDAILNKYICDYNFYYPNNNKIIDYIKTNKISIDALDKSILINKAFFLLESIKTLELKKCIVYLKTIEESEQFKNVLKTINLYYELNIGVYNINYNSSKSIRNSSLTKFRNNQTKITILLNVHILDEGIDIPECDSVYLTHPNNNPINIIQRISRANRIYNGKNTAHILVWSKNNEKIDNIIKVINSYIPVKFNNVNSQFINENNNGNIIGNNDNDDHNGNDDKDLLINKVEILNKLYNYLVNENLNIINKNWVSLREIFRILGYSDIKKEIKRLVINTKYIIKYEDLNIKNNVKKIHPHTVMIDIMGVFIIINKSTKEIAAQILREIHK